MGQMLDSETALSILQPHWDTWITEQDFKDISAAVLTHVRYVSARTAANAMDISSIPSAFEGYQSDTGQSRRTSPSRLTTPGLGHISFVPWNGLKPIQYVLSSTSTAHQAPKTAMITPVNGHLRLSGP